MPNFTRYLRGINADWATAFTPANITTHFNLFLASVHAEAAAFETANPAASRMIMDTNVPAAQTLAQTRYDNAANVYTISPAGMTAGRAHAVRQQVERLDQLATRIVNEGREWLMRPPVRRTGMPGVGIAVPTNATMTVGNVAFAVYLVLDNDTVVEAGSVEVSIDDPRHAEDVWFAAHTGDLRSKLTTHRARIVRIELLDSISPCARCCRRHLIPLKREVATTCGREIPLYTYCFRDDHAHLDGSPARFAATRLARCVYRIHDDHIARIGVWDDPGATTWGGELTLPVA